MNNMTAAQADHLARLAARCRFDPLLWAETAWDWGRGELARHDIRAWQADVLDDIAQHLMDPATRHMPGRFAVSSGHGIGKGTRCRTVVGIPVIAPHTMTLKPEVIGMEQKKWGDLRPGDYVFGADGAPTRITATHYYRQMHYRVTFDDGSSTVVSAEHEWNVRGRQERRRKLDTWRTLETQEILALGVKRPNGKALARQWEIPVQGAAQFKHRAGLPLDPYVMGVWLSDGSGSGITKDSPAVRGKLAARHHAPITEHRNNKSVGITRTDWGALPVFKCRSREKYIPDEYKFASVEQRQALFDGLMDGDGEVHKSGSLGYGSVSERLLDDVIWLARSLGYKAMKQPTVKRPTYTVNGETKQGRPLWRATINTTRNPFTHEERKAAFKPDAQARYLVRWIDSIEPVGEDDGMCITVEAEDSLYLANDFIVTHNSAGMGMLANWAMSCHVGARVVVTANTEGQLRTKTSPEIATWFHRAISAPLFNVDTMAIRPRTPVDVAWSLDFTPWSINNTEAFAGLHAQGRLILLLMDEASAIDDKIWEVAEGALTDEDTILLWVAFGNPTRATGAFRECWRRNRTAWNTRQIDSRNVEGTNKQYLQELVDRYGEDSDVVKVRVRGMFPSTAHRQLIPTHLVDEARGKHLPKSAYEFAPVILTCDPAWTGDEDLVIAKRQGLMFDILHVIPKNDNDLEIAALLAREEDAHGADAVFIDFGYGTGIKSAGDTWGRAWQLVNFASKPSKPGYINKRAEIWDAINEWLAMGGSIPDDDDLYEDLIGAETKPTANGAIQLLSKEEMKRQGLPSPNRGDALALSFAAPVIRRGATGRAPHERRRVSKYLTERGEYNPYADVS